MGEYPLVVEVKYGKVSKQQIRYDIESLFQEARSCWLKLAEVHFILQNHEKYQLNQEAPQKPSGGSVFLFNKRVLRFFRKDGRAIGEAHERLKGKPTSSSVAASPEAGASSLLQALRRLEEQLSLNDDIYQEIDSLPNQYFEYKGGISKQEQFDALLQIPEYTIQEQYNGGHPGFQDHSSNFVLHDDAGIDGQHLHQSCGHGYADGSKGPLSWQEEKQLSSSRREMAEKQEHSPWPNFNGSHVEHSTMLLPQEVNSFKSPAYSSVIGTHETNSDYNTMFFDQDQIGVPLEGDLSLTVAQKQKFTIREISPEWGYTTEATKVIIAGSFFCDPLESSWLCMFGDIEVPIQIIQDGVIRCEAPPRPPGKVTLCITSDNRESCSEVKEFDYRIPTSSCIHDNSSQTKTTKSRDKLLLLVRCVQMLLSYSSVQKGDDIESGHHLLRRLKADDELWGQVIEALLVVRNAAQAAAHIQSAFRAHSFRTWQQKDAAGADSSIDQYGIDSDDIPGLLAMSKLTFRNVRDYNSAVLSVQKKYRGWKGHKDYLAFHKKVLKIQVRKNYKVICWAVGVLDKVILQWRCKGVGLRGFQQETESSIDDSEDEDILKVLRKRR
ncbi:hypothetical protein LWI29_011983 [Acer saccharum]|uniref:CG-1 domain-containing protein n=1 Tax=Acer saccharum TaxID=4024 RepID=A0AA39T2K6_ACESA|nr:hypothetical protein LWI29_011983 [Acer saccharum]